MAYITHDGGNFSASGNPSRFSASMLHEGDPSHVPGRVVIVRHGRTRYNLLGRIQGVADIPLDDHGCWQARTSAAALRSMYVDQPAARGEARRQLVVSSDLTRARQTAQAFADPLGLPVHLDERLEERYFGQWEGMTFEEIKRQSPDDYYSWLAHEGGEMRHGFEPADHAASRGAQAVQEWAARCDPGMDLFVFAHGSVITLLLQKLLGTGVPAGYIGLSGMGNARWAEIRPNFVSRDRYLWTLDAYNAGPPESLDDRLWNGE